MILVYFTLYFTLYRGWAQGRSVDKAFNIYHINEIHLFMVENFEKCVVCQCVESHFVFQWSTLKEKKN